MATTDKDMGNMIRSKRKALDDYMYEEPAKAGDDLPLATPADDALAEEASPSTITVLAPDDPSDPEQYTYEKMDSGAWMVYPPGVPCEAGKSRIQLDHPATESEYADMDAALAEESGESSSESAGESEASEEY